MDSFGSIDDSWNVTGQSIGHLGERERVDG